MDSLSGWVYSEIKSLILCRSILPGQKPYHQELSEGFRVSRTRVRQALSRLAREGYVSLLPNRPFSCKEIGLQEAGEPYDRRQALQAFVVEKAVERWTPAGREQVAEKMWLHGAAAHRQYLPLCQAVKCRDMPQGVALIRAHIRAGKKTMLAGLRPKQQMREGQIPVSVIE